MAQVRWRFSASLVAGLFLLTALPAWCVQKISAQEAVTKARKYAGGDWQIAFVSNTGVTQSVTASAIRTPQDGLMDKNGKAGQWVIEFFRDKPKSIFQGGRKGKAYPYKIVMVTAQEVSDLPDDELAVPNRLARLDDRSLAGIGSAVKLAQTKANSKFDALSIASDVRSNGTCTWVIKFYNVKTGAMAGKVTVSGDGRQIVN